MSPSPIAIAFRLTFRERLKANATISLTSVATWVSIVVDVLAILAFCLFSDAPWFPFEFPFIAVPISVLAMLPLGWWLTAIRYARAERDLGRAAFEIADAGLHIVTDRVDQRLAWQAIRKFRERAGFQMYYFARQQAMCFPLRAFASREEADAARALARSGGVAGA